MLRNAAHPPQPWLTLCLAVRDPADGMAAAARRRPGVLRPVAATTLASTRFRLGPIALVVLFAVGHRAALRAVRRRASRMCRRRSRRHSTRCCDGINPYAASDRHRPSAVSHTGRSRCSGTCRCTIRDCRSSPSRCCCLAGLTFRGQPLGLALFATMPLFVQLASDGSNDHTAALLVAGGAGRPRALPARRRTAHRAGSRVSRSMRSRGYRRSSCGRASARWPRACVGVAVAWLPAAVDLGTEQHPGRLPGSRRGSQDALLTHSARSCRAPTSRWPDPTLDLVPTCCGRPHRGLRVAAAPKRIAA